MNREEKIIHIQKMFDNNKELVLSQIDNIPEEWDRLEVSRFCLDTMEDGVISSIITLKTNKKRNRAYHRNKTKLFSKM